MMNIIALIVVALIFIGSIVRGFKKGMIQEIVSVISMIIAGVCLYLILSAIGSYRNEQIGKTIQMVIVLFVVCFVYKIVNVLFTSLKLIAKLPVIKGLNAVLGAILGAVEAVVIVIIIMEVLKFFSIALL
jgi:uncharacterized membrane protein required for colicin V production